MAFTNFCCRSGGSNLNAGTLTGDTTEPGTSASFTYASGDWVQGTGVFTVASGNPSSDGVAVGDFASVYADGSSVTGFIGRVTARDATTITVSLTAKSGTAPTDGTGNRTLKIGGAWQGPNAASGFGLSFVDAAMTNSGGDAVRINFKNDATYSITAAITTSSGKIAFEGYTSSYGDGGRATIDGGTSGASYVLVTLGTTVHVANFILQNNGATGSAAGLVGSAHGVVSRVVVNSVRGNGINMGGGMVGQAFIECEVYSANQSNTASGCAILINDPVPGFISYCIVHDNTGSNTSGFGFAGATNGCFVDHCISDSNGAHGAALAGNATGLFFSHCDFYNNGGDGIRLTTTTANNTDVFVNCNFIKNGGWGINRTDSQSHFLFVMNCGYGAGTQQNTSGTITGSNIIESGAVTYAADVTPWVDPADGDFRINLAAAQGAGRGSFTQTQSGYGDPNATVGYPNIGAAQHSAPPVGHQCGM